jgi:S-DNA-T family DNA segregation ATPase FtsK/SpoIIIE
LEQHNYVLNTTGKLQIGIGRGGRPVCVDFAKYPHLLVAGETGSGKSVFVKGLICSLILQKNYKLMLIDLKHGTEFRVFRNHPSVKRFARTIDEAVVTINVFLDEINRRYEMFYEKGVNNVKYTDLDQIVLVIDEFAEFVLFGETESINAIKSISAKGRAAGCFLIACTQRPDKDVITGVIKSNFTNVCGLKTENRVNSDIIGIPNLENMRGEGHGIFKSAGTYTEFQAPLITDDDIERLIGGDIK